MRNFSSVNLLVRRCRSTFSRAVSNTSMARPALVPIDQRCRAVSTVEPMIPSHPDVTLKRVIESEEVSETPNESARKKRKRKQNSPAFGASQAIFAATKRNDCEAAMERFRLARDAGLKLPQGVLNAVLYLLVGGEEWFARAEASCQALPGMSPEQLSLIRSRDEVLEYMKEQQLVADEVVYIAQARMSACLGDPGEALRFAEQMLEAKFPARLRFFTPALVGFAQRGEMEKALHVQTVLQTAELDLTELEFRLLLKACCLSPGGYPQVSSLLKQIGKELTYLQCETIAIAREYFDSAHAVEAFKDGALGQKQMWLVEDVRVDAEGYAVTAGERLRATDLEDADWTAFLKAFEDLALSQERKSGPFQQFVEWIDQHGPFDFVVDGANIAFHKQNFDQGGFSFDQISKLIHTLEKLHPNHKTLLVLHVHRAKGKLAGMPIAKTLLSKMAQKGQLYITPVGSNDDWYWLYATLRAKGQGYLISNDECRDHIFQLLAPKYFLKWKERHLIRFEFVSGVPTIQPPAAYTCCTQQLENGSWMLPYRDAEGQEAWLCAKAL